MPARIAIAGVEHQSARRLGGCPVDQRVDHPGTTGLVGDARPPVFHAVSDLGPTIVLAGLDQVELVAAAGTVLVGPDVSARGIQGKTLDIAVAVAVDLGSRTLSIDDGVVGMRASILGQPQDLAEVRFDALRLIADVAACKGNRRIAAVADTHEQALVRQPKQARAEVLSTALGVGVRENDLDILKPIVPEPPACERGAVGIPGPGREGEIDQLVALEIRMQGDIQQTALAVGQHGRQTIDRLARQGAVAQDSQTPRALGDQRRSVREPGDGPGMLQPSHNHLGAPPLRLGYVRGRFYRTFDRCAVGEREPERPKDREQDRADHGVASSVVSVGLAAGRSGSSDGDSPRAFMVSKGSGAVRVYPAVPIFSR